MLLTKIRSVFEFNQPMLNLINTYKYDKKAFAEMSGRPPDKFEANLK